MYMPEHEKTQRTVVHSVTERFLRRAMVQDRLAGWSMDQLARLSILEGAAGKAPGTWLRHKSRGFGSALEFFGPKMSAAWTSLTDQGVYNKAIATAAKALSGESDMDAMDLIQNLTMNSGGSGGPDRNRIFHSVGKKIQSHRNDLGAGDIGPTDWRVLNALNAWVNNAAKDVLKSVRSRRTVTIDPAHSPLVHTQGGPELDDEKREGLLLLALQSPGGPGLEVRRIVDRLIDQSFGAAVRPLVRVFLEKISQPKYRSADQMRRMVKRFDRRKWFKQAFNLVRQEMMAEMGVSPQQLTNALGGDAKKVFRFMREKVGRDPHIKGIVEDLAAKIELLEPGVARVGKEKDDEKEAELTDDQTPKMPHSVLQDWFEKDEHGDWGTQVSPHTQHSRGAVPLRVAVQGSSDALTSRTEMRAALIRTAFKSRNMVLRHRLVSAVVKANRTVFLKEAATTKKAAYRPAFLRWVEDRKFQQPDTGNKVLFVSLSDEEQKRVYAQWQHDRLEWANRHKPEGLSTETRLTEANFDDVKKDDVLWLSWSPVVLHKVVNIDRSGARRNNPIIEFVQVDPNNPEWRGDTRHMHKSTLKNTEMEAHSVPGLGATAEREKQNQERREKALSALPQKPAGGWPDFQGVAPLRHGDDAKKAQGVFKELAQGVAGLGDVSFEKVQERLQEAIGHRAGPRGAKEILKELGKWADDLGKAAKDGGMKTQVKAFRAVRLKVDEALRKADDAIEEHVQAVRRLGRGRPMMADDILQDARARLSDKAREAFGHDFAGHLTQEWDDPGKKVRELKALGRKHFGRNFNEAIFRDMLLRAWSARASWRDAEGVRAIRDNLKGMTGRVYDEMIVQRDRDRRDRDQFPAMFGLPYQAMRAVRHAVEQGVEDLKGGQKPDNDWLDKIVAKAAEGHKHDVSEALHDIVGAMANLLKDDIEDAAQHPSANRQSEGTTWGPKLKKLQEMAGKAEREAERGVFQSPPKKAPKKAPKKEKAAPAPPNRSGVPEGRLSRKDAVNFASEHAKYDEVPEGVQTHDDYKDWLRDIFLGHQDSPYNNVGGGTADQSRAREVENHVDEIMRVRDVGSDWYPGQPEPYRDPSEADWIEQGAPYVPPHYRGVHEGREELRGKPRNDVGGSTRIRPPQVLISLATPSGLSASVQDQMRRKMRDLTLDGAKDLFGRINHAVQNPESTYMAGLQRNGYTGADLKRLQKGLKKQLTPYVGRHYVYGVLAVANNNDLEPEDADELYAFRENKPPGAKLSNTKIFKEFLTKAKPETRERMRRMRLDDFMDMYEDIKAEGGEDNAL